MDESGVTLNLREITRDTVNVNTHIHRAMLGKPYKTIKIARSTSYFVAPPPLACHYLL